MFPRLSRRFHGKSRTEVIDMLRALKIIPWSHGMKVVYLVHLKMRSKVLRGNSSQAKPQGQADKVGAPKTREHPFQYTVIDTKTKGHSCPFLIIKQPQTNEESLVTNNLRDWTSLLLCSRTYNISWKSTWAALTTSRPFLATRLHPTIAVKLNIITSLFKGQIYCMQRVHNIS